MSRPIYRICFFASLAVLGIGWALAFVTSLRLDGRPPPLWFDESEEIEQARRSGEYATASERSRIRGTLRASPDLLRDSANLAREAGDPALGVAALERLVRLQPFAADARVQLASALVLSGRHPEAIEVLHGLLEIYPNHPRAKRLLEQLTRSAARPS